MARRRSAGEGSIHYWESRGYWVGRITMPDGTRKPKYSKSQKVVKDWLLAERGKLKQGIFVSDDKITLETYLRRYMEDYAKGSVRVTTYESYKGVIENHIIPNIGSVRLSQLRADHINFLLSKVRSSGVSDRYVEYVYAILKSALNWAVTWELLNKNPVLLVAHPRVKYEAPEIWSPEQLQKFLDHVKDDRWAGIYNLSCLGMRKGEILGLPLRALNVEEGYLMVIQNLQFVPGQGLLILEPKTDKSRRLIRLPDFIRDALKVHLEKRAFLAQSPDWKELGLVFTTDIGTAINPQNMLKHFKANLRAAGLSDIRFQDLRHSIVSFLLVQKNLNPKLVAELVGHSTTKLTMDRYAHLINPLNTLVADTLGEIVAPKQGL
jgi:integrase